MRVESTRSLGPSLLKLHNPKVFLPGESHTPGGSSGMSGKSNKICVVHAPLKSFPYSNRGSSYTGTGSDDKLATSNCESSVVTNVNGYWKQDSFLTSAVEDKKPLLMSHSMHWDSSNEEPIKKPQPFLTVQSYSSSEEEIENRKPVHCERTTILNCKGVDRNSARIKKGHVLPTKVQNSLMAFIKRRAERSKLYKLQRGKSNGKQTGYSTDIRKPWAVGELLWARPRRPDPLPWWPAIVVQRPNKPLYSVERT
ncbi:unnamed protein product [Echinostoma caproni]|uniref:PWWP domain-containing protein n=1 Tax=Echinostoma caproni TaxID=27848 RepID=A0A183AXW4_9TREM|nr:unnamed protein product [Echinostoma caproni]